MIIGITGASGAGKTVLAKKLAKTFVNSVYIEGDKVMRNPFCDLTSDNDFVAGLNKFKFANPVKRVANYFVVELLNNRDLFNAYYRVFSKNIDRVIAENKDKLIIIDTLYLPLMPKYLEMCDYKILVEADETLREQRVLSRGNANFNEIQSRNDATSYIYDRQDYDCVLNTDNPLETNSNYLELVKTVGALRDKELSGREM